MPCPECGASRRCGLSCAQQWQELLALEFSDPRAGRVHFLTVACYQLQHPRSHALCAAAVQALRSALEDVVVHGRSVAAVRDAMQQRFAGTRRVRSSEGETTSTPPAWSVTVADLGAPDPAEHDARIREWARAVLEDLGSAPEASTQS